MLTLKDVGYEAGGHEVFQNVSFSINKGDKIGLVGRNGVGKTTLLNIVAGNLEPTQGEVFTNDYEVGVLPQDLREWLDASVYHFIEGITGVADARTEFEQSCEYLEASSDDRTLLLYADALDRYNKFDVANFENNLQKALALAGIAKIDVNKAIGNFSGGQKTRIALAAIFASRHDVVLLDEPTNNLDTQGIVILEKFIGKSNAAFMMVSHDRRFLRNATSRIIELMGGDKGVRHYGLGYDEYVASREAAREATVKRYEDYEDEKKRLKKAAKEANARASSAASRSNTSDNDKLTANFRQEKAASGLSKAAQGLLSRLDQLEEPERPEEEVSLKFLFKEADNKKISLITANEVTVSYDGGQSVIGPLSLHLRSGDKISISGPNGSGKTSLLKALMGEVPLSGGSVNINKAANFIYMNQDQSLPLSDGTAYDNLKYMAPHLEKHEVINLLLRFNISKDVIHATRATELSGGERAKVLLASIAANQANLLVMDEPTNNLDIPTIEALEEALKMFTGGVIIVSHDREFLSNIAITQNIDIAYY